jgi:hypothetical protein
MSNREKVQEAVAALTGTDPARVYVGFPESDWGNWDTRDYAAGPSPDDRYGTWEVKDDEVILDDGTAKLFRYRTLI